MTFADYKKHFEIFSKIDTPEKLAICEMQYHKYLKRKEGYAFFEPIEEKNTHDDWLSFYLKNLYSILKFDKITNDQILFLVQPSFEAEHLLIIDKLANGYTLTQIALEESYWLRYQQNQSIATAAQKVYTGYIGKKVGDQIFDLIEQSIIDAKTSQSQWAVLDGTVYKLSKVIDSARKDVFKHSPEVDSMTGRIINLFETLIRLTEVDSAIDLEKEIESQVTLIRNGQ